MRSRSIAFCLLASLLLLAAPLRAKDDWMPITAADLTFKDPNGSSAVILYLQDDRDDSPAAGNGSTETVYYREKILTEEGKKHADIEIPYLKDYSKIEDIKARVVQADGAITIFDGKIYDKTIVKSKTLKILVRTFTIPNVQVGSIVEYRYKVHWTISALLDTAWRIQQELPLKHARFTLKPYTGLTTEPVRIAWNTVSMPAGYKPQYDHGQYWLEVNDIPAMPDERFSPPEDWVRMMVRFTYTGDPDVSLGQAGFWQKKSQRWAEFLDSFVGKHKLVDEEVAKLIVPSDAPEAKLRKLYDRAQQIHNTTYDRAKTEKEEKHDKTKDNNNADDVLKHGYGIAWDINALFIAMARSAGFDASLVRAAPRDSTLFTDSILESSQLSDPITLVKLADKQLFLAPGTLFCPFGVLNWEDTGVSALVASKSGGPFVNTPTPRSVDALTIRQGNFHLNEGGLEGTVAVTFRGVEALRWRLSERENDDTERRKDLIEDLQHGLSSGATIEITSVSGWTSTNDPLVVTYKLTIPGAATQTGKRLLLQTGVFQSGEPHPFQHAERVEPVYYSYPFREGDDITIAVPAGYQLEGKPDPKTIRTNFGAYQHVVTVEGSNVHVVRRFIIDGFYFQTKFYPDLRAFYDSVRAGDGETVVMKAAAQ